MNYISYYESPLGELTLASDGTAITGIWFDGQKYFGAELEAKPNKKELPVFKEVKKWLDVYFAGKDPGKLPPLHFSDTPFREKVWKILLTIPYGKTMTYGEIAKMIAEAGGIKKMSAQAVGGAVGHNPISILCPCHRVVGTNGSLTGYAAGMDKKVALLTLEKADMKSFFVPKKGTAL